MRQPRFPYVWVINDTPAMIRHLAEEAGVRFRLGPHQDGDRGMRGFFVHAEDLCKLKGYFFDSLQLAEAGWTQEAIDRCVSRKQRRKVTVANNRRTKRR